ncbi:MAG: PaaI family thioesterase [Halieaceae bacterium]|uniref:PaaI family thioesterase n=1 Tax=Haliea alexandrii TaxID=2448162 RepID=UPI00130486BD|nr:PaaI family thioesterase [Haliea alexandrii]MCR9183905.1 PaaI family thioesterase [Halieaceae bacterium]
MSTLSASAKAKLITGISGFIPHTHLQGICLEEINGEELTLRLPFRNELVGNPETGTIHGGALTVLLDHTLGVASLCCDQLGTTITPTLDLRIDHLGVAPAGKDIFAVGRVYHVTRRIVFSDGFAYCESRDKPIAKATGTWVFMPELDISQILTSTDLGTQL